MALMSSVKLLLFLRSARNRESTTPGTVARFVKGCRPCAPVGYPTVWSEEQAPNLLPCWSSSWQAKIRGLARLK